MSSKVELIEKLKCFYKDIDSEIAELTKPQTPLKLNQENFCDLKRMEILGKMEKNRKKAISTLNVAKKVDKDEKQTVKKRFEIKKKPYWEQKSEMMSFWNDELIYANKHEWLKELLKQDDEESKAVVFEKADVVDIAENEIFETRTFSDDIMNDASTSNSKKNVRFLIPSKEKSKINERNNLRVKMVNKKIQTNRNKGLKTRVKRADEKSFPKQVEHVVDNEKTTSANIKEHVEASKTTSQQLQFSATTFTSTNGHEKSNKNENTLNVKGSNLATTHIQQMSKVVLPVLSIKGECSVQKIYNFEIAPTTIDSLQSKYDRNNAQNVKLLEITHEPVCVDLKKEIVAFEAAIDAEVVATDITEKRNMFVDINDVRNSVRFCNVNVDDGKIHVVVDRKKRNKEVTHKLQRRRKRTVRDFKGAGKKGAQQKFRQKSPVSTQKKDTQQEGDSSNSLTDDDRKLCGILKFYGENNKTKKKAIKDDNLFSCEEDRCSYPTNTSSNETPQNVTNEAKKSSNSIVNESFKTIYKLIEDTFQSNLVLTTATRDDDEKQSQNAAGEMKQVIKMSEENIKRADRLLQKYTLAKENKNLLTLEENRNTCKDAIKENIKEMYTGNPLNLHADRLDENVNLVNAIGQNCVENIDGNLMQCQNYKVFTQELHSRLNIETSEAGVQTTNDKALQTDENFDSRSRFYFKTVFDNYSNINFDKSSLSHGIMRHGECSTNIGKIINNPVPYNPMYSNDDEIMKVANRFLRSVEKHNKKKDIESSEDEILSGSLKQSNEPSTSLNTPVSDAFLRGDYSPKPDQKPSPSRLLRDLDYISDGEVLSEGEVRRVSYSSDESFTHGS